MNWNYYLDSTGIMRLTWQLCTWSPILLVLVCCVVWKVKD